MTELIQLFKTLMVCFTLLALAFLVLLALPQSKLRSVGMEFMKWCMAAGLALLTLSPIDMMPDVIPVLGWADDLGYIVAAVAAVRSAMREREQRQLMQ